MTNTQLHALSTASAALILFQAVCHETIGIYVFPFAYDVMGGAGPFHTLGIFGLVLGAWMVWSTLTSRTFLRLPAVFAVVLGVGLVVYVGVVHGRFHVFALTFAVAGIVLLVCDRTLDARSASDRLRADD